MVKNQKLTENKTLIERRKIEHEFGELDVQIKRPQRKQEKPKQERSNKSERVKNLEKIAKALEKDQPLEKEEKSGKLWNISITIFLILFAVLLLYSKYNQEKYQRIARYNRGEGLQEVSTFIYYLLIYKGSL